MSSTSSSSSSSSACTSYYVQGFRSMQTVPEQFCEFPNRTASLSPGGCLRLPGSFRNGYISLKERTGQASGSLLFTRSSKLSIVQQSVLKLTCTARRTREAKECFPPSRDG